MTSSINARRQQLSGCSSPVTPAHAAQYENGEPCAVCGHTLTVADSSGQKVSAYPSTILPQLLYLGSYDNASRSELLKTLGITHILNVRSPGCHARSPRSLHCLLHCMRASCSVDRFPVLLRLQTVPSCQTLYKNSFTYHTASTSPPEFRECFDFLGGAPTCPCRASCTAMRPHCTSY